MLRLHCRASLRLRGLPSALNQTASADTSSISALLGIMSSSVGAKERTSRSARYRGIELCQLGGPAMPRFGDNVRIERLVNFQLAAKICVIAFRNNAMEQQDLAPPMHVAM